MKHSPAFLALVEAILPAIREVSVEEVQLMRERLDNMLLIDVREESEWNAGRIPGAQHLGRGVIERDIETVVPDKAQKMVLYCGGGYRSALAADSLQKMGYRNILSMAGGWRGWNDKKLPVIKG